MLGFFYKRWFLTALVVLITTGLTIGSNVPTHQLRNLTGWVPPRVITVFVLFLMAFSLDTRQLWAAFRSPQPVVLASLVNFGVIPLFAWLLVSIQSNDDFACGLMIAASVPCTLAAASVWTRRAGGNDAVSLLVTLLTNSTCFLLTPFWLNLTMSRKVSLDVSDMILRLLVVVLIPTLVGQGLRCVPRLARFATNYKTSIGVVAQSCILLLVFVAACDAGTRLTGVGRAVPTMSAVLLVWGSCVIVHVVSLSVGVLGAKLLRMERAEWTAVAFASSQKTLPIGVYLATDEKMFGNPELIDGHGLPFAVFPMIMYHASQLFVDTMIADRLAANSEAAPKAKTSES